MTNKNMNKKFSFGISSKMFITIFLLIGLVTSPLTANISSLDMTYAEQQTQQTQQHQQHQQHQTNEDDKKEVFHSLTSTSLSSPSSSASSTSLANSNGVKHNIEMVVITLPSGQPAYKLVSHVKSNSPSSLSNVDTASVNNNNNIDLSSRYSELATIPGPTLVVSEGDYVKVNIKDKDGNFVKSEEFIASQPGTFLYIDDSKDGDNGLFGAVIVNPKNNLTEALIKGEIQELPLNKLDKDVLLFMVGSTFWGMEIDNKNNYKQSL